MSFHLALLKLYVSFYNVTFCLCSNVSPFVREVASFAKIVSINSSVHESFKLFLLLKDFNFWLLELKICQLSVR